MKGTRKKSCGRTRRRRGNKPIQGEASDNDSQKVAAWLQVDHTTVHRWLHQGRFPGAHKAGPGRTGPYRIPKADVIAFEEKIGMPSVEEEKEEL